MTIGHERFLSCSGGSVGSVQMQLTNDPSVAPVVTSLTSVNPCSTVALILPDVRSRKLWFVCAKSAALGIVFLEILTD